MEQAEEDSEFLQWYVNMVEKFPNTFVHYLSKDALLHWFGRSIKGPESILYFIKCNMKGSKHIVEISSSKSPIDLVSVRSTPFKNDVNATPESNVSSVYIEVKDEFAGGDGFHIDELFGRNRPADAPTTINCFKTTTFLQSNKSCDDGCNWKRPCTLVIKYTGCLSNPVQFNINSISYDDHFACRRNLFSEFEKCASDIE